METENKSKIGSFASDLEGRIVSLESARVNARWWKRATLAALVLLVFVPFAANALGPMPYMFSAGSTISASEMNANFEHLRAGITAAEAQVPAGAIIFYNGPNCPDGWSEVMAARGRALVGMNGSAGMLGATVGTGLSDRENRTHTHSVDIRSTLTSLAGSHNHEWFRNRGATFNTDGTSTPIAPVGLGVGSFIVPNWGHGGSVSYWTSNEGEHRHTVDPAPETSTVARTADVMPYVQYLVCQRS